MENEEDFLRAASILKGLDLHLSSLSESAINKAQVEARKDIESQFEKSIQALQARKENLLREVDTRFKHKRKLQENKEHEIKTTLETCRKLLLAGVAVYNKDKRDEAVNIWKSLSEFAPKNGEDQIKVSFSDTLLHAIATYGSVSGVDCPPSLYVDTPKPSESRQTKLNKSSEVGSRQLRKSSEVETRKLGKSSEVDPPKSGKSPDLEHSKAKSPDLSKSPSAEPPTRLGKSSSSETRKLGKSTDVEPPKQTKSSDIEAPRSSKSSDLSKSPSMEAPTKLSKSSSSEPSKLNKSSNIEPSTRLGKSQSVEPPKATKSPTEPPKTDAPNPPKLGRAMENLSLDRQPDTTPVRLGKTSGVRGSEATKISLESPRAVDCPTLVSSPKSDRRQAAQNKVTTVTELNYGLEGRIGSNAQLRHPNGICFNPYDKSLYVCDNGHVVFKVTSAGEPKLFSAKRGDNQLYNPMGITCYYKENCFFVTSQLQHTIKMINSMGIVTVVAGCGKEGSADGIGNKTGFSHPVGITLDQLTGDLYVSDFGNHTIRKISPQGVVTTLAGTAGKKGFADGVGKTAVFNCPYDLCFNDKDQSLLVCDSNNNKVRRVALNGEVTTIAEISRPTSIALTANGSFLVASQSENKIYHVYKAPSGYKIETVAGSGRKGGEDGNGGECSFSMISGITMDEKANVCYVAEHEFSRIRKIQLQQ
jgi:hypothetical protein